MRYIDTKVVETVRPLLIGRQLMPVLNLNNAGIFTVRGYHEVDMSGATVSRYGKTPMRDRVELESFDVEVPVISKDYKLNWRDVISSRNGGIPLETRSAENAARQVAEEEDLLIISGEFAGHPALGIDGLVGAAGNTINANTWPTNVVADISDAIAELEADGHYGPYASIMTSVQAAHLRALVGTTNMFYFEVIKKMLTAGQGIYVSDNLYPAGGSQASGSGSALVIEMAPDNFELVIGRDTSTYTQQDEDMNLNGKVYEVVVPRVKRANSICELTTVTLT
jgi:uncharacterized linocin/CFP29 family protein